MDAERLLAGTYAAFNARDIDSLIDPTVEPTRFVTMPDGRVAVEVHQIVRDLGGTTLKDQMVRYVYTFESGLIRAMEIRPSA